MQNQFYGLPLVIAAAAIALGGTIVGALLSLLGTERTQNRIDRRERQAALRSAISEFGAAALDFCRVRTLQWLRRIAEGNARTVTTPEDRESERYKEWQRQEHEMEVQHQSLSHDAQTRLNSARARLSLFETPEVRQRIAELCNQIEENRPSKPSENGTPVVTRAAIEAEIESFIEERAKAHKLV